MDTYKLLTNFSLPDGRTIAYETEGKTVQDACDLAINEFTEHYRCSRTEAILYIQGGDILQCPKE